VANGACSEVLSTKVMVGDRVLVQEIAASDGVTVSTWLRELVVQTVRERNAGRKATRAGSGASSE
jgi:hypothetical protein